MRLIGKRCLVTGGGAGIGAAIAQAFAMEGAHVAVLDINPEAAARTAEKIGGVAVAADVANETEVQVAIAKTVEALGGIDVLVNNAGIDTSFPVAEMPIEAWDRMIAVNLRSVFLCSRLAVKLMIAQKWGRIINISSQLAQKGAPEMAHYAAAKAGVIGFTRSLAYEVADKGITVNAICPGPVDTELWQNLPQDWRQRKLAELPIGRPARVEEILPTAVMLAADDGGFYVGATLNPNGGDIMV